MGYVSMWKNASLTHRKWMWADQGKTTGTKAIQQNTVVALMFMFMEVDFFFSEHKHIDVCEQSPQTENSSEFSLFETETPLNF